MATLKNLIEEKNRRLDEIPLALIDGIDKAQKEIFDGVLKLLDQLDVKDGKIIASERNLALIEEIGQGLKQTVFQSEYLTTVKTFLGEFDIEAKLNQDIIEKAFGKFTENELYSATLENAKRRAADLLNDGAIDQQLIKPVQDLISGSIVTNGSFTETISAIKTLLEGNQEVLGNLARYSRQIAYDSYLIFDRSYMQVIADDLGAEFYMYSGGLIRDSRDFCKDRVGNVYTIKEIESWASEDWQGKNRNTNESNIRFLLGGYNCQHTLIPVAESQVPKELKNVNI